MAADNPGLEALGRMGLDPAAFVNPRWRLNNLYTIITDEGVVLPFRENDVQRELFDRWWYLNLCLKSRQHGFTTAIDLLALDHCVFIPNYTAAIIADTKENVEKIFRRKIREPWEKLPAAIRQAVPVTKQTESEIVWANGSSISVGLSLRGGTAQFLHVSELGKISRRFPEKANEIKTGAFEAIAPGQTIVVESTAEGNGGLFHDLVVQAQRLVDSGRRLTPLDFRLHFFPWFRKPANTLSEEDAEQVPISARLQAYFHRVEERMRVQLSRGQRAWYAIKEERMGEDLMRQEHPSTPEEPFEVSAEGMIFGAQMALLRRRNQITKVRLVPGFAVNTFWDWGLNDTTFLWFHQRVNGFDRFILDYENNGEAMAHYAQFMRDTEFALWGKHYVPHDFAHRRPGLTAIQTLETMANEAGIWPTVVVPRVDDKRVSIQQARQVLPNCFFDAEECARGIACLDNYSKQWNELQSVWRDEPRHDEYSNGADAFQTFAMVFDDLAREGQRQQANSAVGAGRRRKAKRNVGWRAV